MNASADSTRKRATGLPLVIVSGSPGTGKTTVAAHLARGHPRGLHLPADVFYTFPAHRISPYRRIAHAQNTDIIVTVTRTAASFAERGYAFYLDGIFGPWFLPVVAGELLGTCIPVAYVVLHAPLELALGRIRGRPGHLKEAVVRRMHAQFENLGIYAPHALETDALTPEAVAAEFARRRAAGEFALDLQRAASMQVV